MKKHGVHLKKFQKKFILFITAMRPVSNNGMENMRHMLSQLVHASGGRYKPNQRIPGSRMFSERYCNFCFSYGVKSCKSILNYTVITL